MPDVTYEVPVPAKLMVKLANGQEWEATPDDLRKFNLETRGSAYRRFSVALAETLRDADLLSGNDLTDAELNPLRYLVELCSHDDVSIYYDESDKSQIAAIEQILQTAKEKNRG